MSVFFVNHIWSGLLLWIGLYISDYYLTISCARMYRAQDKIRFEGSFEITPYFQSDIDALKTLSPRFIIMLFTTSIVLSFFALLAVKNRVFYSPLYLFFLGYMVLLELTVHIRHIRNWFMYRDYLASSDIRGHIEYSRSVTLKSSAIDRMLFSALFLVLFFVTASSFVLGGAAGCTLSAWKHYSLAKKCSRANVTAG
jgi:hypothetical protein